MKYINFIKEHKVAKSVISIILALCLLITPFGFLSNVFTYAAPQDVWGGQSDLVAPIDSDSDGVFEINKASEFAYIVKNGGEGKSYILTEDIYLNDTEKVNWENGTAIGDYTINSWYDSYGFTAFSGKVDGNGHTVYGMYVKIGSSYIHYSTGAGLFPVVSGETEIKNLGVDKAYVDYECYASAFVGTGASTASVTIDGCYVGSEATLIGYGVGAFRGYANGMTTTVTNCYSLAKLDAKGGIYGLSSLVWGPLNISNSFNANGPILSDTNDYQVTITDCYQTVNGGVNEGVTTITADNMKGKDVFESQNKMPSLNTNNVFTAQTGFPVLSVFESLIETEQGGEEPVNPNAWDGTLSEPDDTNNDGIYEISKGSELAYVIKNGGQGRSYVLLNDIHLNDIEKVNWETGAADEGYTPYSWYGSYEVTPFSGNVDGNGHSVYGIYFDIGTSYGAYYDYAVGLFPAVEGTAEIKNLGVDKVFINYEGFASAFVGLGKAGSSVVIDGCFAGENVYMTAYGVGVFRGSSKDMSVTVSNSYSLATLNAQGGSYGFASNIWGALNVSNSFNANGPIFSETDNYYASISNSYQTVNGGVSGADTIAADNMKGMDVFESESKMPKLNQNGYFAAAEGYPDLKLFVGLPIGPDPEPEPDPGPGGEEPDPVPDYVWDGNIASPSDSDSDGVFEINNAEELAFVIKNGGEGKEYILTADIYLNDITKVDWQNGTAIGTYTINSWYDSYTATTFSGKINGNGHTVYGMYVNVGSSYVNYNCAAGLIPAVADTAEIKNLGVDNAYINYECYASAFVGMGTGSTATIDSCYVGEKVYITAYGIGAFRGYSNEMTTNISNSYSLGNFTAKGGFYGLASIVWGPLNISNSFSVNGPILSDTNNYQVTITSSYQTANGGVNSGITTLSADNMKGADALTNENKMPALNTGNLFTAQTGFPVLTVFASLLEPDPGPGGEEPGPGGEEPDPVPDYVWDGTTSAPLDIDNDGVFEITNAKEFAYIIANGTAGNYILTEDIYLNDINKVDWQNGTEVGDYTIKSWYDSYQRAAFSGTVDGNGHTVYGMYINVGSSYINYNTGAGLFPSVNGETKIKNLGVDYAFVDYECYASAFVGAVTSANVTVDGCFVGENVNITAYGVGAFRGYSNNSTTKITNSYSLATLNAKGGAFGLASIVWGSLNISNSFNANGPVLSDSNNYGVTIKDCYQTVDGGVNDGAKTITKDNMKGEDVFTNENKMPLLNSTGYYVAKEGYPEFALFNGLPIIPAPDYVPDHDPDFTPDFDDSPINPDAWDGSLTEPKDLDGNGVYEIYNASELAYAIKNGGEGKKYKLKADIYINDINKIHWATGKSADGYTVKGWFDTNSAAKFRGSIDGAGHTVYGMYLDAGNTGFSDYVPYSMGLIPHTDKNSTVEIKNLFVDNIYVNYECYASALIGRVGESDAPSTVIIENCGVGENVYIKAYSASVFRGYTYNGATVIKNSYSLGKFTSNGGYTGFVAMVWGETEIQNCYNANGPIISDSERYKVNIKNCYQTVMGGTEDSGAEVITKDNMQGKDVFENNDKMPKLNEDNVFIATEGFPVNYVFTDAYVDVDQEENLNSNIWDGSIAETLSGSGTEKDPYLISNGAQLALAITSGGKGAYYKLTKDIYLNDIDKVDWKTGKSVSVGYRINSWFYNTAFEGNIDGDGHTVFGLYFKTNVEDKDFFWGRYGVGLIPKVEEGKSVTVKRLGLDAVYVSFECGSSAFVGYAADTSKLSFVECYVGEKATIRGNCAGALRGLSGDAEISIANCYSLAETVGIGKGANRGLIGTVWGPLKILNSYNANGPLTDSYERYNVIFEDCYQTEVGAEGETGVVTLKVENMKGKDALTKETKMPALNKYEAYIATDTYPVLNIFSGGKGAISLTDEGEKGRVWSGKLATKFAGGSGTMTDPYLIETPEQLALLISGGSGDGNNFYKLTADIILNDTSKADWEKNATPWFAGMSTFRGTFDGNGHTVSGLYYNGEANGSAYAAGLFQRLGVNSKIMRVGVTSSKIYAKSKKGIALAGAIVGWIEDWNPAENKDKKAPVISQCFADDTVFVEGTSAGGIVGGAPTWVEIDNCYFTGELTGKNFAGAIVGDAWAGDGYGPVLTNCFATTLDRNAIGGGDAFRAKDVAAGKTTLTNAYVDGIDESGSAVMLSVMYMRGESAKANLKGFDFNSVWKTVKGGTPVLKCFADAEKYSCKREPSKVSINFGNLGGIKLDAVSGIPGYTQITEDTIPKPYRYGYLFKGWHHFNEYGAPFELDVFPDFDITLYAEWEEVGFTVSFENELDEKYDYNSGMELYKPGIAGYNPKFIRSGWRSLHAKADSQTAPTFLLSYENALEVGKEYHLSIWLSTDTEGASGEVIFTHSEKPDVNLEGIGYQTAFKYSGLKVGEWTQYEVKFIANAPYILISSPVGQSIFFEDIHVVPTGEEGKLGGLKQTEQQIAANKPDNTQNNTVLVTVIIICASVIVLAAIAVSAVIVIRKKKKAKGI